MESEQTALFATCYRSCWRCGTPVSDSEARQNAVFPNTFKGVVPGMPELPKMSVFWKAQTSGENLVARSIPLQLSISMGFISNDPVIGNLGDFIKQAPQPSVEVAGEQIRALFKHRGITLAIEAAPARNWMPVEIEYTLTPEDGENLAVKEPRLLWLAYRVDESIESEGHWFPARCTIRTRTSGGRRKLPPNLRMVNGAMILTDATDIGVDYVDQPERSAVLVASFSNPVFTDKGWTWTLETPIPEGQAVQVSSVPLLPFEWRGGRVVGVTDEAMKALAAARFHPAAIPWIRWLVLGAGALGLAISAWWIFGKARS